MKKIIIFAGIFLLIVIPSHADIYEWIDENGSIHFVDDMLSVPHAYKDKVKVYKQKPPSTEPAVSAEGKHEPPATETSPEEELFGGYPLDWWKTEFDKKKEDVSDMEKIISDQKKYIGVYQKGSRVGQIFKKGETETYEEYKRKLPLNEEKLDGMKRELEEFRRKATLYGVPRSIRE